jgi:hypothetical protein
MIKQIHETSAAALTSVEVPGAICPLAGKAEAEGTEAFE